MIRQLAKPEFAVILPKVTISKVPTEVAKPEGEGDRIAA
jgi:hypothetical protein